MPKIGGPCNFQYIDTRNGDTRPDLLVSTAKTLGAAIRDYESAFTASIRPYDGAYPEIPFGDDGPKYFYFSSGQYENIVVDIHIQRGNERFCPKQDLSFPLLEDDVIDIGTLIC